MARKVFISILGTGYYIETKYYFGVKPEGNEKSTRFIQENTLKKYCENWNENDKILIFLTKDARTENWNEKAKVGHPDGSYTGLSKVISMMGLKPEINDIDIDDGFSETEIWNIFNRIYTQLKKGDEVYFDITHAFRYLPMLSMVLINYSKFLKNIKVKSITYGAFEKLGPAYKVKDIDEKKRFAPILDLTSFSALQDWTSAASDYINYGDADYINSLTKEKVIPFIKENSDDKFTAIAIKAFVKNVFDYTQNIKTVRGFDIYKGEQSERIKNDIGEIKQQSFIKPLIPILEKIENNNNDTKTSVDNIFNAVEYCIKHNLIQQGITFLQEGIISVVLNNNCIDWFVAEKNNNNREIENNRNIASSALTFIEMKKNQEFKDNSWHFSYWDKENIDKILSDDFSKTISSIYVKLSKLRNDINHSGYIEKRNSKDFAENLDKLFLEFKEKIKL